MGRAALLVAGFWALQVTAQVLPKWGSDTPGRAVIGFWGGHAFAVTSIVFVMLLYKTMNPNLALGLCFGGSFLMAQVAVVVMSRAGLTALQAVGIATIVVGMVASAMGRPPDR